MRAAVLALLLPLAEAKKSGGLFKTSLNAIQKKVSAKMPKTKPDVAKARRGKALQDCTSDPVIAPKMVACMTKADEATCTGTSGCAWCLGMSCFPSDVVCTAGGGVELNNGCPTVGGLTGAGATCTPQTDEDSGCEMSCACMTSPPSTAAQQTAEDARETAIQTCEDAVADPGSPPADKTDAAAAEAFCAAGIAEYAGKGACHTANPRPAPPADCAAYGNCEMNYQVTKLAADCPADMEQALTDAWPAGVPAGAPSCTAAALCAAQNAAMNAVFGTSPASTASASLLLTAIAAAVAAFSQ